MSLIFNGGAECGTRQSVFGMIHEVLITPSDVAEM
jgi:hypothetical protein